jgi:7-cyano-7-deazaguanine synthase in queuosine biosynthesis
MSITPKRSDILNKTIPIFSYETTSNVICDNGIIEITIVGQYDGKQLASYWYQVPNQHSVDYRYIGIMEALAVSRLSGESLVNIIHNNTYPIPKHLDELLSTYGLAAVKFIDESYKATSVPVTENTLMFSGGCDSTHLLTERLNGNCNLVSFAHGQSNYRAGLHSEETASLLVPKLVRSYFNLPIEQVRAKSRWKIYTHKQWAKVNRNLFFMVQAASIFPNTNIFVGTSVDDRLSDSFPDFISGFSNVTGISVIAPNIEIGRDVIMRDLIQWSIDKIPYLYSSTSSCQLQRYCGKSFLNCGSCHSCILRTPAVVMQGDPRFANFNGKLKLIPEYLEGAVSVEKYFKRKPSINILKVFFDDLSDNDNAFQCFLPTLQYIDVGWEYPIKKILNKHQMAIYESTMPS